MQLHLGIEDRNEPIQISLVEGPDELSNWVVNHKLSRAQRPIAVGLERLVLFPLERSRTANDCLRKKLSGSPTAMGLKPRDTS